MIRLVHPGHGDPSGAGFRYHQINRESPREMPKGVGPVDEGADRTLGEDPWATVRRE